MEYPPGTIPPREDDKVPDMILPMDIQSPKSVAFPPDAIVIYSKLMDCRVLLQILHELMMHNHSYMH